MKKLFTILFIAGTVLAATAQDTKKWQGANSDEWDYATPNWLPLAGLPLPTMYNEGDNALFDDSRHEKEGENKVSVMVTVEVPQIEVNNSTEKPYYFSAGNGDASFAGEGVLIKKGDGELTSNVTNNLEGGTIVEGGIVITEKNDSPNIFGSKVVFKGGSIMTGTGASGDSNLNADIEVDEGEEGTVITTRYTKLRGDLTGSGTLNIVSKGERVFLVLADSDWSQFTGEYNIIGDPSHKAGYLGLGLEGTLEFDPIEDEGVDQTFANNVVNLTEGAFFYSQSGNRCYEIGHLTSDATSGLRGYMRGSTTPMIYYKVGGLNKNSTFAGQIRPEGTSEVTIGGETVSMPRRDNTVGLIKVGTGTMKLTHGENFITGGIDVKEGRVLISNAEGTRSGTGYSNTYGTVIWVRENASAGGTGRISGNVEVEGTFAPGNKGVGTITIKDFEEEFRPDGSNARKFQLIMKSNSILEMQLGTVENSDKVIADSIRVYENVTLDIKLANSYSLQVGDEIQLWDAPQSFFSVSFETINLPMVDEGWEWDTSDLYETGVIKLTAGGGELEGEDEEEDEEDEGVGIENVEQEKLSVYPNPNNGNFTVQSDASKIEIYSMNGQLVYSNYSPVKDEQVSLNVQSGIYLVKVYTKEGTVVQKIVVK